MLAIAGGVLWLAWLIGLGLLSFQGLASFPGIHFDETWFALAAVGLETPVAPGAGMTWYSGSLMALILSVVFEVFSPGYFQMRAVPVLGLLGFAAVATLSLRGFGKSSVVIMALLLSQSLFVLWYGRVAWEVTGLMWLVLAASLAILIQRWQQNSRVQRDGFVALLYLLLWLGMTNHMMAGILLVALCLALAALLLLAPEPRLIAMATTCGPALILLLAILLKPLIGMLEATAIAAIWAYYLLPPFLVFAARHRIAATGQWIIDALVRQIGRKPLRLLAFYSLPVAVVFVALTSSQALFLSLTNAFMIDRVLSGAISPDLRLAMLGIGFAIFAAWLGLAGHAASSVLKSRPRPSDMLLLIFTLTALIYCAILAVVIGYISIRHMAPALLLIFLCLAIGLPPRLPGRRAFLAPALLLPMVLFVLWVDQTAKTINGATAPIAIGFIRNDKETSAHFLPQPPLIRLLQAEKICPENLSQRRPFKQQARFAAFLDPWPCQMNKKATASYCTTCSETGFFKLTHDPETSAETPTNQSAFQARP